MAARSAVPRFQGRWRDADVDALPMLGLVDVRVPFMLSEIPLGHPVAHRPPVLRGVDERGSSLDQHADVRQALRRDADGDLRVSPQVDDVFGARSEEHTSELQSLAYLVCRLLLEKKKNKKTNSLTQ